MVSRVESRASLMRPTKESMHLSMASSSSCAVSIFLTSDFGPMETELSIDEMRPIFY